MHNKATAQEKPLLNTETPAQVKRSFTTDILSVFSSNVSALAANLLLVILLTNTLGPEGYGLYTAVLVIPFLVVSFFQMGIRPSTIFLMGSGKHEPDTVVSAVMSALLITASAGIFFSLIGYLFMFKSGFTILLTGMALLTIPMRLAAIYAGGVFLAKENIRKANLINWLTALLTLVFAAMLVWLFRLGVNGAILSLMSGNLLVAAYAVNLLRKEYKITISLRNPLIYRMIKLGVVFALSFLMIQLNYRVDILLLQWMADAKEVGLYSLGVSIAELLWQIPLAVSVVVMTRSANTTDITLMSTNTARLLRLSLLAGVALSFIVYFISPVIIPLVWPAYTASIGVVQTILPGIVILIVFRILSGQLSGMGKPNVALKALAPSLVMNVVLNYFLIPLYGGIGAAIATNISYFTGTLIYVILYCRITGITMVTLFSFSAADFKFIRGFIHKPASKNKV